MPLPAAARSVEILRSDEPIHRDADAQSPRRGSGQRGARLPIYAVREGPGCSQRWLMVGPLGWLCADETRFSHLPALTARLSQRTATGLPMDYFFVAADGAQGFANLALADQGIADVEWEPGFAIAVRQRARSGFGTDFGLTSKGFWIALTSLRPARPQAGLMQVHAPDSNTIPGWTYVSSASVQSAPEASNPGETLERLQPLQILEQRRRGNTDWLRLVSGGWIRARDVRVFRPQPAPADVLPGEHWIDVDLQQQVVTAYEGATPVFSTLASTGRGRGSSELATPPGEHRIWVKLTTTDMSNLENAEARRYYSMDDVPWVMFFKRGYGLHGAFWHRSFGNVRSHGCVNLAPADAEAFFRWAGPRLPPGWSAVHPTEYDPGTRVVVR